MTMTALQAASHPRARDVGLAIAAILLAVALAHGESLRGEFVAFDDEDYVQHNPYVQGGVTKQGLAWAFHLKDRSERDPGDYFHPLAWVSLMASRELLGPKPWAFHLVNVCLHGLTGVLLFLVLVRSTGRFGASLAAALLFAVHPLTVEGVAWIFERKTCLAGSLGIGAVLAYVWYAERPSALRLALVTVLQGLSLLARPTFVVLPALLLLLDYWPLRRLRSGGEPECQFARASPSRLVLEKVPLVAVSLAFTAAVFHVLATQPVLVLPLALRVANAIATVPKYLAVAFWPARLTAFRPFPEAVPAGEVALGVAVLVGASAMAIAYVRKSPWVMVGWLWFVVSLLPHLGIKQNGLWPAWADRFAYVALIGLVVAVVFAANDLMARASFPRFAPAALVISVAVMLTTVTRAQVRTWSNSRTLFTRVAEVFPGDRIARYLLGTALLLHGDLEEADREFVASLAVSPLFTKAWGQLGTVRLRRGMVGSAEECYRRALALEPSDPESLYSLAQVLENTGRSAEARPLYARFARVASFKYEAERRRALQLAREQ